MAGGPFVESTTTAKDYFDGFETSPEEVEHISGAPTFLQLHEVFQYIERNCMAIPDDRDLVYQKGHLVADTSLLPNGPAAQIAPSVRPAALLDRAANQTQRSWDNYTNQWTRERNYHHDDQQVQEAIKKWFFMVVDEVHFAAIKDSRTGFRGRTVREIMAYCTLTFPPEPEDNRIVEDMLREEWDPGDHISTLWAQMQRKLRLFAVIERGPGSTYTDTEFIKYTYLTIEATKEFTEDCEKWKHQIPGLRNTEAQLKTYFSKAYVLYVKKGASMREANIANQAEIVSILAAKSQEMEELRTEVATSMAQERAAMQSYIANHTTDQSVFSAMTASTEQLQRQNDELGQRLAAANAQIGVNDSARRNSNRRGGGGSSSTASGTPWSNQNGGGGSNSTTGGTPWANRNGGGGSSGGSGGGRGGAHGKRTHACR